MTKRLLLSLGILLLLSMQVWAGEFYVSGSGATWVDTVWNKGTWAIGADANSGVDIAHPKATVDAAINLANAAGGPHTIYIAPATYSVNAGVGGFANILDNANHAGLTINGAGRLTTILTTGDSSYILYHTVGDGINVNNLTLLSSAASRYAFYNNSAATTITFTNVDFIADAGGGYDLVRSNQGNCVYNKCRFFWSNDYYVYNVAGAGNHTFNYCISREYGKGSKASLLAGTFDFAAASTNTFNNCEILDGRSKSIWSNNAGCTINVVNSIVSGALMNTASYPLHVSTGALNVSTDTLVLGNPFAVTIAPYTAKYASGATGTPLSGINPRYTNTPRGGYVILEIDDTGNYPQVLDLEDTLATYGYKGNWFVVADDVGTGAPRATWDQIKDVYSRGRINICSHSRSHTSFAYTHALRFTPPGGAANPTVSFDHTTFTWTLNADGATYDVSYVGNANTTLANVITNLNGSGGGWVVAQTTTDSQLTSLVGVGTLATDCADTVAKAAPCDIDFDDGRRNADQIDGGKTAMEAGMTGTGYICNSIAAPGDSLTASSRAQCISAGFTGARGADSTLTPYMNQLSNFQLYAQFYVSAERLYGASDAICRANVTNLGVAAAQSGMVVHIFGHNTPTKAQWAIIIDQISKIPGLTVITMDNFNNMVQTGGLWTYNVGTGDATRTYNMTIDNKLKLISDSTLINAGTPVVGLTTDYAGMPIIGNPDVGSYEFISGGGLSPVLGISGGNFPGWRK